jgi:hypothetical protein
MVIRVVRTGCVALALLKAFAHAQGPSAIAVPPSEGQIYESLFRRMAGQELMAAKVAQKGKSPDMVLAAVMHEADLTKAEDAALKQIASQCNSRVAAIDKQAAPLVLQGRKELSSNPSAQASVVDQLKALQASRTAALAQCTEQLRTSFGPERFARFDAWVHSTAAEHIRAYSVPTPADKR